MDMGGFTYFRVVMNGLSDCKWFELIGFGSLQKFSGGCGWFQVVLVVSGGSLV